MCVRLHGNFCVLSLGDLVFTNGSFMLCSIMSVSPYFQEWRDCIAIELINRPISDEDGVDPPQSLEVVDQSLLAIPIRKLFSAPCDPFDLFMYEVIGLHFRLVYLHGCVSDRISR